MNAGLYRDLNWLLPAPPDFRGRCRATLASVDAGGRELAQLAKYALDENQLRRLAAVVEAFQRDGRSLAPLTPFRLGVLGNATLEPVIPALIATACRHGIALECVTADFGQTVQQALDPQSAINRARPDAILIALDHRGLPMRPSFQSDAAADDTIAECVAFLSSLRDGFRRHSGALSIVQTVTPPPEAIFGSVDRAVRGSLREICTAFNATLSESVGDSHDVLFDVASLAETVGSSNWHSPVQWNLAKLAFDADYLPLYADHVCRIVGALRGKSRRCLVLDLDNTLWGGVVGDDGLEGLVLGQGNATGEAYLDVQRTALSLRDRGVVLAVSSKNDDETARAPFRKHPEMLLREEHIAVFQANWNDKATNITAIADELALGIDAFVFLDDNPVERGLVRELLPAVAVPELPDDPALYARTLLAAGYFEAVSFSDEDRQRAEFYQGNARRATLAKQAGDVESYLASLDMTIDFRPFDATGRSRIAQLINKSNQFNLTTRRYTEADVEAAESDPDCFTLQTRLADAFGDNGMIGVLICRPASAGAWEIDTWLMSCRVLGRKVEHMVLREVVLHARSRGIRRLVGRYVPTDRNRMVEKHYDVLGFRLVDREPSGTTVWELDTGVEIEAAPMTVERYGFELSAI
jgi:FkbH-like protein